MRYGGGARLGNLAGPNGATNTAAPTGTPRVLVIEDDEGLADVLVRALRPDQFDLTVANRGMQRSRARLRPS